TALGGNPRHSTTKRSRRESLPLNRLVEETNPRARRSLLPRRHHPADVVDVEDDAVGILELALEALVAFLAKVEEKFAPGRLDRRLPVLEIVDLEPEVMDADERLR